MSVLIFLGGTVVAVIIGAGLYFFANKLKEIIK